MSPPVFNVDFSLQGLSLIEIFPLLSIYAPFDLEDGSPDLFIEPVSLIAVEGRLDNPELGMLVMIGGILENACARADNAQFNNDISLEFGNAKDIETSN